MLGMPFLSESIIDLKTKTVKHKLGEFPFITHQRKIDKIIVKGRTKQLLTLTVNDNNKLTEGYLPFIPTGPVIPIKVFCINCNTRDVELSIPPITLQKFETLSPSATSSRISNINGNLHHHYHYYCKFRMFGVFTSKICFCSISTSSKTDLCFLTSF